MKNPIAFPSVARGLPQAMPSFPMRKCASTSALSFPRLRKLKGQTGKEAFPLND